MPKVRLPIARKFCRLLLAAALAHSVSGAVAEPLNVSVGIDPGYVAFFVAKDQNLFEKHGLDVKLIPFASGAETMDAINAGAAAVGASAEPTVMTRMTRGDIRAIAVLAESGSFLKLVGRSGVTGPEQLRSIGMVPGGALEYLTSLTMKKHGLEPRSTKVVKAGPPEMPALLARGDIDSFWLFEPFTTRAVENGAKVLASSGDVGYVYNFWLTASGSWFESHRDETRRLLLALDEACVLTTRDPALAAEAVRKHIKLPVEQTVNFLKTVTCRVRDFRAEDLASYDGIAAFLLDAKIIPQVLDYRNKLELGFWQGR